MKTVQALTKPPCLALAQHTLVLRERAAVEPLPAPERLLARNLYRRRTLATSLACCGVVLSVSSFAPALAGGLWLLITGAYLVHRADSKKKGLRTIRELQIAAALLCDGEVEQASRRLDELTAGCPSRRSKERAMGVTLRGSAAKVRGDLMLARRLYLEALGSGWLGLRSIMGDATAADLAVIEVLDGRLHVAEAWLETAGRQSGAAPRWWLPARALLYLRNGEDREAQELVNEALKLEGSLTGSELRGLKLLRAYCAERMHKLGYRDSHAGSRGDELARDIPVGYLDYLAVNWPEMREFMARHGLLGPPKRALVEG